MSASPHPDTRYIQALLDNDNREIAHIYSLFAARIERLVCTNSGSADDARDVFQEALLTISQQARRPGFVLTCPFEAYLYLVCRGKWLNEIKRRKRTMVTISDTERFMDETEADALAESVLMEDERNKLFRRFFDKLSENCRALLKLSWTGLSMQEVGETLGMTYGYARKRKSECIAQLTEWIQAASEFSTLK
ncbi:MAG: sigma-70 family RNA polymerase sigma factor [Saprospiraceae bacterium]